jgi:hypothetical protein
MAFNDNLYEIVRGAVPEVLTKHCNAEFELLRKTMYLRKNISEHNKFAFGDSQVPQSFAYYSALVFETLSETLRPTVESVVGKPLYSTYSYARIYYTGATMAPHTDRPSCEYSTTICMSNDPEPWEIWFETKEKQEIAIYLEPGDMLVYKGDVLNHWRNEYMGNRQCQAFLHYVDKFGKYRDFKNDGRIHTGIPKNGIFE